VFFYGPLATNFFVTFIIAGGEASPFRAISLSFPWVEQPRVDFTLGHICGRLGAHNHGPVRPYPRPFPRATTPRLWGLDGSTPSLLLATRRHPSSLRLTAAHPRDASPPVLVTRRRPAPPPSFVSLLLPRWRVPPSLILVIQMPPFPLHQARRPHCLPIVLPLSRHRRPASVQAPLPASVQATQHVSSLPLLLPRVSTPLADLICFRSWRFQSCQTQDPSLSSSLHRTFLA
jgi:hypothetical protein